MTDRQRSIIEQRIAWTHVRRQTDKDVLTAMARWFCWRGDGSGVRPSSIAALAAKSGVPKRSVDRALARLIAAGYLQVTATQNRGASTYQMVLTRLATEDPDHMTIAVDHAQPFERQSGARPNPSNARVAREIAFERQSGARTESGAREKWPDSEKVARPYRSEEVVGVEIYTPPPPTDRARHNGARTDDVTAFAAWWTATYPHYRDGAQNPIDARQDGHAIEELLDAYPVNLQAMALLMWQVVPDRNPKSDRSWIANTDRGLRVLARKAAFLHLALRAPEQLTFGPLVAIALTAKEIEEADRIRTRAWGGWCQHDPRCEDGKACVRAIAIARHIA